MPHALARRKRAGVHDARKDTFARHNAITHGALDGAGLVMTIFANTSYFQYGTVFDNQMVAGPQRTEIKAVNQQIFSKRAGRQCQPAGGKCRHVSACHQ